MSNWLSLFSKNIIYLNFKGIKWIMWFHASKQLTKRMGFFFSGWPSWGLFLKWGHGWFRCQGKQFFLPQMVPALSQVTPDDLHMEASLRYFKRPQASSVHSLNDGHCSVLGHPRKKNAVLMFSIDLIIQKVGKGWKGTMRIGLVVPKNCYIKKTLIFILSGIIFY